MIRALTGECVALPCIRPPGSPFAGDGIRGRICLFLLPHRFCTCSLAFRLSWGRVNPTEMPSKDLDQERHRFGGWCVALTSSLKCKLD